MKYLCLCYYDAEKEAQLSQEELEAIGPACKPHDAALRATGKVVVQGSLAPYQEWKTIRPVNGTPVVSDGPLLDVLNWLAHSLSLRRTTLMKLPLWHRSTPPQITGSTSGWQWRLGNANHLIERVLGRGPWMRDSSRSGSLQTARVCVDSVPRPGVYQKTQTR